MYKIKLIISALFLFALFNVYSQDKQSIIEVTGNAEIKIEADNMEMSINVNVDDDDLITAKNKNDESTKKVLAVLKRLNIDDKDIVTSGIKMSKIHDTYNKNRTYYTVANSITLKTGSIGLYEDITTELISIEDVYINNISMSSTKAIETRVQARENALLAAKKKAEDMAAVLNMSVGKPLMITENMNMNYYPNPFNATTTTYSNAQYQEGSQDIFKAGLINVTASVKVVFSLTDK